MYNILVKEKDAISELAEEDLNIRNSHRVYRCEFFHHNDANSPYNEQSKL